MNKEVRAFAFEVRAEENEQHGTYITGTPIVFGQETDLGWYREKIDKDALTETDLKDVRFLIGHNDRGIPLARSRNNNENSTMQLTIVPEGMDIRVDLDTEENQDARTLYSAVKRGDISGMSFMFTVDKSAWEEEDTPNPIRRITHIDKVFEVSAVAFPAYDQTTLQAASADHAPEGAEDPLESALRHELEEVRNAKKEKERKERALAIMRR